MKYVLFVCTHNAGRSQMAQAFFERECTHDCRSESAGSDPASDCAGSQPPESSRRPPTLVTSFRCSGYGYSASRISSFTTFGP
jgi:protein-tyrosine-phosphatase